MKYNLHSFLLSLNPHQIVKFGIQMAFNLFKFRLKIKLTKVGEIKSRNLVQLPIYHLLSFYGWLRLTSEFAILVFFALLIHSASELNICTLTTISYDTKVLKIKFIENYVKFSVLVIKNMIKFCFAIKFKFY